MKTLEEVIRECAAKGELSHVSIAFTTRGWAAAYRGATRDGTVATHSDPVCALLEAMTGKPGTAPAAAPRVARKRRAEPVQSASEPAAKPLDEFDDLLG